MQPKSTSQDFVTMQVAVALQPIMKLAPKHPPQLTISDFGMTDAIRDIHKGMLRTDVLCLARSPFDDHATASAVLYRPRIRGHDSRGRRSN
jgi:hypothetical protein